MIKAVYPGSFDPITRGHVNIIERASRIFSELHILIADSQSKKCLFDMEERKQLISELFCESESISVATHDGLTVDYLEQINANIMLRGIRAVSDFEYEMSMAATNKIINRKIETVVIFPEPQFQFISSRLVKEVVHFGGDISQLVPENVEIALKQKLCK